MFIFSFNSILFLYFYLFSKILISFQFSYTLLLYNKHNKINFGCEMVLLKFHLSLFIFYLFISLFFWNILANTILPLQTIGKKLKSLSTIEYQLINISGPFCREEIPLSYCPEIKCFDYDKWYQKVYKKPKLKRLEVTRRKVVLSIGHNGFGNQLFQHYFALQVAQHVNARLYFSMIESEHFSAGYLPPNTIEGTKWIKQVSDPRMFWSSLPSNHPDKLACSRKNLTYSKRPADIKKRIGIENTKFQFQLLNFLDPEGDIECLITLGYFQNKETCFNSAYKMWPSLINNPNRPFTPRFQFNPDDIVIHLRCAVGHYGTPSKL